ncbi:MAG: multicopper oxidase domain-containing protein [Desulfuromonadaceae bacterium]|nr:multicopper oxidase domain-containing protein [Desulfuromonadaceae bacterium]
MKNKPHIKRFTLALMMSCIWSVAAFAAPGTVTLPDFSKPVLDGATQPSNGVWDNVIPNALADYYTYVPYTTADAVALGFPATCGNVAKGDAASTEDCYTITVRSFQQALSLQGIFGGGPGLVGLDGVTPLSTRAYGYGSGGPGWVLPYYDTTKPGVVAGTAVTGNAPAGPLAAGIWHFPAPTIKGAFGRPIRVQWLNELPNVEPTGLDPSVDCGPNAPNCFPYNRIVTHVHGAHVGPESDGLASAWFTPNFSVVGEDFVSTRQHGPEGTYLYPMDQEASTIWYHDHAMGSTHNNTNMGMAGFLPITDANEKALQTCTPVAPATTCQSVLPVGAYELGFALQDRHFDAATGNMVMPDYSIYDRNAAGCTLDVNGLPDPLTCPLVPFMKDPADGHLVSYVAGHAWLADPINAGAPFGGTSATLEYFGNIPVVNGVVYGNYSVEPRVYRMRFIGGTDSRTWVMKLVYTTTDPVTGLPVQNVVPFWQIGTEQGFLNNPLYRSEMDLMPGERVDVLVDFTGIPAGTKVMMQNLGPDTPWPGYFDYLAGAVAPSVDIPEIMAFNVGPLTSPDTVMTPSAAINLRPLSPPVPAKGFVPAISNTRVVSLMEITDGYGRTMPTIDARGFKPAGIPVTEIIKLNDTEQWDIVNTTVDAHPMHLHQVAFKIIDRQAIGTFTPPTDDILNQVFTPPSYTVAGGSVSIPADAWDDGWKDTIAAPPGYVTRVWAKFDLSGEYVWHCHILSHEEHDMMRNFIVTDAALSAPAPASITVPSSSTTGSYTINWVGTAIAGVTYELQEATDSAFATAVTVQNTAAPSFTAAKTLNNSFYYRVRALPPAASGFNTGVWRTASNPVSVQLPLAITPATLPVAAVNAPYSSATASAVNGVPPYSWSAVGLPASLTIDPATGLISGTPTPADILAGTASSYAITVTVTDSSIPAASQSAPLTLVINQVLPAAPSVLTATAASTTSVNLTWTDNANNETDFTVQRTTAVTGVIATFTAPANATTFTDTTAVAGTTYSYSVAATNALGSSAASNNATVAVPAVLVISTVTVPAGAVNALYTATVAATGGVAPYTWSAVGLPASLTINPATGVISGTPTPADVPVGVSATFPVTVTVQDVFTPAAPVSVVINLVINQVLPAAPTLLTATPASMTQINLAWVDNANNETGFSLQRATDALFTKGLLTVALPANAITYADLTVVANTAYYYRINSLNALGASLTVGAGPVTTPKSLLAISTTTLPNATQGVAYSATLKATGGVVAAYSWSATGLPAGLTIAPTTGIISGVTVALPAIYPVTITVNDGTTTLGVSKVLNLTVVASKVVGAPAQPTGLTAVAAPGTITLAWVDNATTETGFTVQRATDKNFKKGLVSTVLPANTVSYSDASAKVVGTIYFYRVFATNGAVASAFSNVVSIAAQ